jgi:hypothetical protein
MNEMFNNAPISISIIDYIGQVEDGVALLLNIVAEDTTYELGYWYNKDGKFRLIPEKRMLDKLNIIDIYEYKYIKELIYFIHHSLPDTNKILDEFVK